MEQTKALDALAPFLTLAKSASTPRQLIDIINQATSATNTFIFAELLQQPSIQRLAQSSPNDHSDQYIGYYKLLEIFSWGTYKDYENEKFTLPKLTSQQENKLKSLSLLSIDNGVKKVDNLGYSYDSLLSFLSLQSSEDLESLITTAIHNGLLSAVLDPTRKRVIITSLSASRDVRPGGVTDMLGELQNWDDRCARVLTDLEAQREEIRQKAIQREREEREKKRGLERINNKRERAGRGVGASEGTDDSGHKIDKGKGKMVDGGQKDDDMDVDYIDD